MEEAVNRSVRAAYMYRCHSPLGDILLAGDGEALTGLYFTDQKNAPVHFFAHAQACMTPVFSEAKRWLDAYFSGEKPGCMPPLHPQGTAFQREVWQLLLEIPYGQAATYGEIAKAMAQRRGIASMSAQAVGGAVGRNPVLLLIPCHRIIGADGGLTGYAAGIARKRALLKLEGYASML